MDVKAIMEAVNKVLDYKNDQPVIHIGDLEDILTEQLGEWISVEDRLPENGQLVVMYNYDKAYYLDVCNWDSRWDEDYHAGRHDNEVWLLIEPAPQKTEQLGEEPAQQDKYRITEGVFEGEYMHRYGRPERPLWEFRDWLREQLDKDGE